MIFHNVTIHKGERFDCNHDPMRPVYYIYLDQDQYLDLIGRGIPAKELSNGYFVYVHPKKGLDEKKFLGIENMSVDFEISSRVWNGRVVTYLCFDGASITEEH